MEYTNTGYNNLAGANAGCGNSGCMNANESTASGYINVTEYNAQRCTATSCSSNCDDSCNCNCDNDCSCGCGDDCTQTLRRQAHVHEVVGSVICSSGCEPHCHRFAAVSDEAIGHDMNHVHEITFRTDTYEDHYHEFCGKTCPAIPVGDGRHVHFLKAWTTADDGHRHEFRVATLIENPSGDPCETQLNNR